MQNGYYLFIFTVFSHVNLKFIFYHIPNKNDKTLVITTSYDITLVITTSYDKTLVIHYLKTLENVNFII